MKKNNKSMTIEDLAIMVKHGFDQTATKDELKKLATKDDLKELATKVELNDLKGIVRDIVEELNIAHADIRYIRTTVDKLVHSDIAQESAIEDLTSRVHRLEQKAGLAR